MIDIVELVPCMQPLAAQPAATGASGPEQDEQPPSGTQHDSGAGAGLCHVELDSFDQGCSCDGMIGALPGSEAVPPPRGSIRSGNVRPISSGLAPSAPGPPAALSAFGSVPERQGRAPVPAPACARPVAGWAQSAPEAKADAGAFSSRAAGDAMLSKAKGDSGAEAPCELPEGETWILQAFCSRGSLQASALVGARRAAQHPSFKCACCTVPRTLQRNPSLRGLAGGHRHGPAAHGALHRAGRAPSARQEITSALHCLHTRYRLPRRVQSS